MLLYEKKIINERINPEMKDNKLKKVLKPVFKKKYTALKIEKPVMQ